MQFLDGQVDINKLCAEVISNNVEKILAYVMQKGKDKCDKIKVDYNIAFTKYLNKSYDKYSKVKTLLYRTEPKYLYDFFECNTLELNGNNIDANDIDNILSISRYLIIQGTGGIGKSTLMKHFFLNELQKQDFIPIFIELKELNSTDLCLVDYIFDTIKKLGFNLDKVYFEYALECGCFLFLFDGYDELSNNKSQIFFNELDDLCDLYSDNYYIISSRPNENFISFQRFTVLKALEFTKVQSISLIKKIDYDIEIKKIFINKLDEYLYETHQSFASNPLLLNIMLLTFDNYAEVPAKLHIFYSNAFETLYCKHDATKSGYKREMKCKICFEEFKKIFAKFCFITYAKGNIEFTKQEIYQYFEKINFDRSKINIENYIYDLMNCICVLYKEGQKYRFTHRSFQEYFTALYLKELSDEQQKKASMYLIESGEIDFIYDSVFSMLHDMSQDRYEKNVIIPILKNFKGNNIKEYLKIYFSKVHIIIYDEEKKGICVTLNDNKKLEFIYNYVWDQYPVNNNNNNNINEFVKVAEQNLTNLKEMNYTYLVTDILESETVYLELIKTWIGDFLEIVYTLLDKLEERQKSIMYDLDNVLFG